MGLRAQHIVQGSFTLIVISLLGACSSYLDAEKVEASITQGLTEQTGLIVNQVSCPEEEPLKAQAQSNCEVTLEDQQTFLVSVIQEDNEGNIRWDAQEGLGTVKGVIDNERLANKITEGILQETKIRVETDCGTLFRIARIGDSFTCQAIDTQNNQKDVTITVNDDDGNVSWEL